MPRIAPNQQPPPERDSGRGNNTTRKANDMAFFDDETGERFIAEYPDLVDSDDPDAADIRRFKTGTQQMANKWANELRSMGKTAWVVVDAGQPFLCVLVEATTRQATDRGSAGALFLHRDNRWRAQVMHDIGDTDNFGVLLAHIIEKYPDDVERIKIERQAMFDSDAAKAKATP